MKFCRYWSSGTAAVRADGRSWTLRCWGGSNTSVADAARVAGEIARRAADAVERGDPAPGGYGYADRPLREEIVDEIAGTQGPVAVVTRNGYGSLILNTARVLFADVDDRDPPSSGPGLLARLFGPSKIPAPSPHERTLQRFHDVVEATPGLGLRVYRTAGGFRCMVTDRTFDPTDDDAETLLAHLDSDPLYVRLCRSQSCFRARLTAKYWRCGAPAPPGRFPFATPEREQRYRAWEEAYHAAADSYAACALVTTFGSTRVDPAVTPIMELHDRLACMGEDAQLA